MKQDIVINSNDFMENKEFVLKRVIKNNKFFDFLKLLFIIIMFPFFVLYMAFTNKILKNILSKFFIILYISSIIILILVICDRFSLKNRNESEFNRIPIEFYDKIKKFWFLFGEFFVFKGFFLIKYKQPQFFNS